MKKLISVFCAIVMIVTSFSFVAFAAGTKEEVNAAVSAKNKEFNEFIQKRFDANGSGKLDAGDARAILLYSAGMKPETANKGNSDADGDGRVTALDARLVLRLSAQLDSPDMYYTTAQKLDYFNTVINSVKPNRYNYYGMSISSTDAVTHDNPTLINSINKQLNQWLPKDEKIDFGAELTQTETTYNNFRLAGTHTISIANFPVYYNDYASILTEDNIAKIEYKKNQTYNYVHYNYVTKAVDYTASVSGLDSITVYVKSDSMTAIPDDVSVLNNGKVFNVLEQSDIDSFLSSSGFNDMDDLKQLGTFKVDPGFNSIKYYNSFVTIYFDHQTGAAVGVDYNLHYDISISLEMHIHLGLTGEDSNFFRIIDADGTVNLVSTMTEKNSYYFTDNNPNHVPA